MSNLSEIIKRKPFLAWYIKNPQKLSNESILEHILNFGDWDDYLFAERSLGIAKAKKIFERLKERHRINLKPKTINYFEKYYQKYA